MIRRRGSMAITIALILVVVAFVGLSATSYYRAHASRNLLAAQLDFQLSRVAQAAIQEAARGRALSGAYQQPDALGRLKAAAQRGPLKAGYLFFTDAAVELDSPQTRSIVEQFPGMALSKVTAQPVYYLPGLRMGRIRFRVGVSASWAARGIEKKTALDYEFSMYSVEGKIYFSVTDNPLEVVSE